MSHLRPIRTCLTKDMRLLAAAACLACGAAHSQVSPGDGSLQAARPAASSSRPAVNASGLTLPAANLHRLAPPLADPFGPLNLGASYEPPAGTLPAASAPMKAQAPKPSRAASSAMGTPAAAPASVAPVPPSAPALPFVAMGVLTMTKDGTPVTVALLRRNDEVLTVRPGELIGAQYRVDSVSAERVELTYLPLSQRQVLGVPRP